MIRKIQKADDEDEFEDLVTRLVKLKDKINKKIDDLKKKNRKRSQCPKGSLPKWEGSCETYLDFKDSMMDLLIYDSDY